MSALQRKECKICGLVQALNAFYPTHNQCKRCEAIERRESMKETVGHSKEVTVRVVKDRVQYWVDGKVVANEPLRTLPCALRLSAVLGIPEAQSLLAAVDKMREVG